MNQAERPASKTKNQIFRILLSLFIVFHVTVIAVMPNGRSYLGRALDPWITSYANFFALNVTWSFFAPEPPPTLYVHYNIRFEDAEGREIKESIDDYVPPRNEKIVIHTVAGRYLYATRFLVSNEKRLKILLAPFLCRQHPGASSVFIENLIDPIANLDSSQIGTQPTKEEAPMVQYTHHCNEPQDEVEL